MVNTVRGAMTHAVHAHSPTSASPTGTSARSRARCCAWRPGTTLIDLSHEIAPGDVAAASLVLAGAAPTFPAGTAPPRGGRSRRRQRAAPARGRRRLGASSSSRPTTACSRRPRRRRGPLGRSTRSLSRRAGRDLPRPRSLRADRRGASARCRARPASDLASTTPSRLRRRRHPRRDDARGIVRGHVVHVDRYGNLVTDVPAALGARATLLSAQVGGAFVGRARHPLRRARARSARADRRLARHARDRAARSERRGRARDPPRRRDHDRASAADPLTLDAVPDHVQSCASGKPRNRALQWKRDAGPQRDREGRVWP